MRNLGSDIDPTTADVSLMGLFRSQIPTQLTAIGRELKLSLWRLRAIAVMVTIFAPGFYVYGTYIVPQPTESASIRIGMVLLALPLFTRWFFARSTTPWAVLYLLAVYFYILPFSFVHMFIMTGGTIMWSMSIVCMLFAMHAMAPWMLAGALMVASLLLNLFLFKTGLSTPAAALRPSDLLDFCVTLFFCWACAFAFSTSRERLKRERASASSKTMSVIAHEFRTPLAAAALISESLAALAEDLADGHRVKLERRVDKLNDIFRGLNSKISRQVENTGSAGGRRISNAEFNVGISVQDAVDNFSDLGKSERQCIVVDIQPDCNVRFKPGKMEQVITNLLSNARESNSKMRSGMVLGDIQVAVSRKNIGNAKWIQITVTDKGTGISSADQQRHFSSSDAAKSWSRPSSNFGALPSHGMGLALCKEVVVKNGGKIFCVSEGGNGATIVVLMPAVA